MQEQEMIELIRQRDPKGAEILLKHYGPLMRYIICAILPDPQDQEECLSEAAMRAWDKISLFDNRRGTWNAWLTALTRNTARNRSRKSLRPEFVKEISDEIPSPEPTPEEAFLLKERKNELNKALGMLSPKEKALFYRKYYYLQSTAQIASELGTTERSVEGKLYRLKKKLRRLLGGDEHGKSGLGIYE